MSEVNCVNPTICSRACCTETNHCDSDTDNDTDERSSLAEPNKRDDSVHLYVKEKVIP